jgi:hypothetical protein
MTVAGGVSECGIAMRPQPQSSKAPVERTTGVSHRQRLSVLFQ